ncbi:MAG: SDR family NAD(P)-dependent oxidoreductase [Bifidobacterium sp.]|uniref:SDR family NAD(P)-dependent oxidoreductase n=2 Tax=Bifidobacterium TaxID=1678 RepID=A0AB39U9G4_9BIFI
MSEKRTALIIGAGGGVGLASVKALRRHWHVIATARSKRDLSALQELGVESMSLDLSDDASIREALLSMQGRTLDALIFTAAVCHTSRACEADEHMWNMTMRTNVISQALIVNGLIQSLRDRRGTIVFVNSGAGERAVAQHAVYAASKHALRGYADTLRLEESANGVRVATLYPGQIDTTMLRTISSEMSLDYEPNRYIHASSVAGMILTVVDAPPDVHLTNLDIRPRVEVDARYLV